MPNEDLVIEGAVAPAPKKSSLSGMLAKDDQAYGDDAGAAPVSKDSLPALRALAEEMLTLEREVARRAKMWEEAVADLADVQENRLPKLMEANELNNFGFIDKTTGRHLTIKLDSKWRVQLPTIQVGKKFVRDEAACKPVYDWFRQIGLSGIIKKVVEVPAGLMPDDQVGALMESIKEQFPELDPGLIEKIEPATLTSQVTKLKDDGKNIHEALRVTPIKRAVVKG